MKPTVFVIFLNFHKYHVEFLQETSGGWRPHGSRPGIQLPFKKWPCVVLITKVAVQS